MPLKCNLCNAVYACVEVHSGKCSQISGAIKYIYLAAVADRINTQELQTNVHKVLIKKTNICHAHRSV